MILVDSTILIDQFRAPNKGLVDLLRQQIVAMHAFVLGEVMPGSLRDRAAVKIELGGLVHRSPTISRFSI